MLIFRDKNNAYVAKVADFGFSTQFRGENDLIIMPKSRIWSAPEHHCRGFSPTEAKRMDVYSFGLLCLWLLFGASGQLLPAPSMTQKEGQSISFDGKQGYTTLLEHLKSDEKTKVQSLAKWLVNEKVPFTFDTKTNLNEFFGSTLAYRQGDRKLELDKLLRLLTPAR